MDALREQLKDLPVLPGQTWLGDRRRSSSLVDGMAMDVVIWVNQEGDLKLVEAIEATTSPEHEFALMARAARQAQGQPERWLSLRPELGLEAPEDRVPLDVAYISLDQTLEAYLPGFLGNGASTEQVAELYLSATDFWQRKLWTEVQDVKLARVEGLETTPLWVSVMGGEGVERGLAIFLTKQGAVAALAEDQATLSRCPLLTLSYFAEKDAGTKLAREVEAEKWPLPEPGLFPWIVSTLREAREDPTPAEIKLVMGVVEAIQATIPMTGGYKNTTLKDGRRVRVRWPSEP